MTKNEARILDLYFGMSESMQKAIVQVMSVTQLNRKDEKAYPESYVITETDIIELGDRFGDYCEFVVRDMVSDKDERFKGE